MTKATEELPLPQAAHLLRKDPQWVRARVIRGDLNGRLISGRWFVEVDSALRLQGSVGQHEVTRTEHLTRSDRP